ncbi:hypothetical protein [Rhodococcus ruber]
MTTKPRMPRGLGTEGQKLWRTILEEFDMDNEPGKLRVLQDACRVADTIAELEAGLRGQPLTVKGSQGQSVIHPLIAEARYQRGLLAQLLSKLGLPDADPEVAEQQKRRSEAGRKAAQARWQRVG